MNSEVLHKCKLYFSFSSLAKRYHAIFRSVYTAINAVVYIRSFATESLTTETRVLPSVCNTTLHFVGRTALNSTEFVSSLTPKTALGICLVGILVGVIY